MIRRPITFPADEVKAEVVRVKGRAACKRDGGDRTAVAPDIEGSNAARPPSHISRRIRTRLNRAIRHSMQRASSMSRGDIAGAGAGTRTQAGSLSRSVHVS